MEFNYNLHGDDDDNEDDVFYAEIKRQILLLTAEDEEEGGNGDFHENRNSNSVGEAKRGLSSVSSAAIPPGNGFGWLESEKNRSVPAWLVNLWRSNGGNGTGVFIPHIVKSRRRHRQRGRKNERGRMYKPVENHSE